MISEEIVVFFVLGLLIGSFLNTVIYRLPIILGYKPPKHPFKKYNLIYPRSHCPKCKSKIPFYLNIPLLAFVFLRGKCFKCKEKISLQYPLVELITGTVFTWVAFNSFDLTQSLFLCFFLSCLIVLSAIDLRFKLVPDTISLSLIVLALLYNYLIRPNFFVDSILGAFIGFSFFYLIEKFYRFLKDKDGLGRGDAKVFSSMGALMGWQSLPFILLAGTLLALLSALFFFLISKRNLIDLKAETIPFVPALSFGLLINLF